MELVTWKYCEEAVRQANARMNCTDCNMINCMATPTWQGVVVFLSIVVIIAFISWVFTTVRIAEKCAKLKTNDLKEDLGVKQ